MTSVHLPFRNVVSDEQIKSTCEKFGTPCYIYSEQLIQRNCQEFMAATKDYPALICFAVKSNSNLSVLQTVFTAGFGADLVSIGELQRASIGGCDPMKMVFAGVGKSFDEIKQAITHGIFAISVESEFEFLMVAKAATELQKSTRISFRINPNIKAGGHEKISTGLNTVKFGINMELVRSLAKQTLDMPYVDLCGLHCHIGSQILELDPLILAGQETVRFAQELKSLGSPVDFVDLGGGLGITYQAEQPPSIGDYVSSMVDIVRPAGFKLLLEPGRSVVGNTGVLATSIIGVKHAEGRTFAVVDAAMNDLARPSVYNSYHHIEMLEPRGEAAGHWDVVGPICETGDFLGKSRELANPQAGDILLVHSAGAYAASMASQYNTRRRAPEIMIAGDDVRLIRPREEYEDLWREEQKLLK